MSGDIARKLWTTTAGTTVDRTALNGSRSETSSVTVDDREAAAQVELPKGPSHVDDPIDVVVDAKERSKIAAAFARGTWSETVVTTRRGPPAWVPDEALADLAPGASTGIIVAEYAGQNGRSTLVFTRNGNERELDALRLAPEDGAYYRARFSDADMASRIATVARQHNRELRHLVMTYGMRPSEARRFVMKVDDEVFRRFLEASAVVFSIPALAASATQASRVYALSARRRPSSSLVFVRDQSALGAAQGPAMSFRPNANGPRTAAEALALARRHGVEFPETTKVIFVSGKTADDLIPEGAYASYGRFRSDTRVAWETFHNERTGKIPVVVRREVLDSDEAIVGILAHEAYELRALESSLADGGSISVQELGRRINDRIAGGRPGNLHEQAWDETNRLVDRMRAAKQ